MESSRATELKETRHGRMLFLSHDRYVGRSLAVYGEFSEPEVRIFSAILKPGDTAIELGSNIGAHTIPIARAVGRDGAVFAVEPQRVLFTILCANIALNEVFQVRAFRGGAGAETGIMKAPLLDYEKEANFGGLSLAKSGPGEDVPIARVDDFALPSLRLLKADVEGMETDVVKGARETISRCRPVLYLENDRRERSPELLSLISGLGYDIWWHVVPMFNPDNFAKRGDNVFGATASINLLCHPKEQAVQHPHLRAVLSPNDWWNAAP